MKHSSKSKVSLLLQELDSTDDKMEDINEGPTLSLWQKEFVDWLEREEHVPEDTSVVAWWE